MKFIKFIFPFLFVRNWHTGSRELSPARMIIFGGIFSLILLSLLIAYMLQAPVTYSSSA